MLQIIQIIPVAKTSALRIPGEKFLTVWRLGYNHLQLNINPNINRQPPKNNTAHGPMGPNVCQYPEILLKILLMFFPLNISSFTNVQNRISNASN
jgi:hypothetical protein